MKKVNIEEFLELSKRYPIFDVRSPGEFEKGHIDGAINLPIVDNKERAEVGTLYAKSSVRDAYLRGLEIIGPKLHEFAKIAIEKSVDNKVLVHCWRGGKRSESMAWLFELVGLETVVLNGGYKSYRRFVQDYFKNSFKFVSIGGYTGSGKTEILLELQNRGEQVIDLEGLANHKGSAFGSIGMGKQPYYETFENILFHKLYNYNIEKIILVEDESKHVGKLLVSKDFFSQMVKAPMIIIERSLKNRLDRLESDYLKVDKEQLIFFTEKIEKRLGNERFTRVVSLIKDGKLRDAIKEILYYYDKSYQKGMDKRQQTTKVINSDNNEEIIKNILNILKEFYND